MLFLSSHNIVDLYYWVDQQITTKYYTTGTNMLEERLNTEKTVDDMVSEAVPDSVRDVLGE